MSPSDSPQHRLFMGCPLSAGFCEQVAAWASRNIGSADVRLIAPENMHVTLLFFGEVTSAKRDNLVKLSQAAAWPAITLTCGELIPRGHGAISVNLELPHEAQMAFYESLGSNRSHFGTPAVEEILVEQDRRESIFAPWRALIGELSDIEARRLQRDTENSPGWPRLPLHVSLPRTRKPFAPIKGPKLKVTLESVALYESHLSPEGASYEILAEGPKSES